MSNVPTTQSSPDSDGASAIEKLHKMSRTAGLGATDYVAVNVPAVAALFAGIASFLVVLDFVTFAIVPVVAIVLAIIAIYQIRGSNGTQTGLGLASLGLLLALGFSGYTGSVRYAEYASTRADTKAIDELARKFGSLLKEKKYSEAHGLFAQPFQVRVNEDRFTKFFKGLEASSADNQLDWIDTSGLFDFRTESGEPIAAGQVLLHFKTDPKRPARIDAIFRKKGGTWIFDELREIFADAPAAPAPKSKPSPFL